MTKYIWVIYREVIEKADYSINKTYEIDAYGTEDSYKEALNKGKKTLDELETLNEIYETNTVLDLKIQTI